jgi:repressor LexA
MSVRVGALIRQLRQQAEITQRQLADGIGMNPTYLSKIENDRMGTIPSAATLTGMADVLGVDRDWLLTQCGRPPEHMTEAIIENPEFFQRLAHMELGGPSAAHSKTEDYRLLGRIAAGLPIEAVENAESFDLANVFAPHKHFLLRVCGDSMLEDGILDGDIAIVHPQSTCENGELVVAIVDGEDATLKRFYREGRRVRLQPANARMQPLIVNRNAIEVRGRVVGMIRTRM